jgi:DNA-binding NtrC family response regulator
MRFKVLLVDDEEEFVRTFAERLQIRGLDSKVALNGEHALQAVHSEVPGVMVLDLRMPGIDGMEVLQRVKKAYPEVQVVILSGQGSVDDEELARHWGAFEYLHKPVDIDDLIQTLSRAYKKRMADVVVAPTFSEAGQLSSAIFITEEDL